VHAVLTSTEATELVRAAYGDLLERIAYPYLPDTAETARRAADAWTELTSGYTAEPELTTFPANGYDEIVVVSGIPFYSLCEHHLLPFHGHAHIAYLPGDRILGLSKFARLVDMFARRLQVQERLTHQVASQLQHVLEPRAVGVVMQAEHLCMAMRGVCVPGTRTTTSVMLGRFRDSTAARAEVLGLLGVNA
jgi:GTP cyclohydrolase I